MAYIGESGGKLSVIPSKGEIMSFVWDVARYIYRVTTVGYKKGDHRTIEGRPRLLAIFDKIDLKSIEQLFSTGEKPSVVDEVILLKRTTTPAPVAPHWQKISKKCRGLGLNMRLKLSSYGMLSVLIDHACGKILRKFHSEIPIKIKIFVSQGYQRFVV